MTPEKIAQLDRIEAKLDKLIEERDEELAPTCYHCGTMPATGRCTYGRCGGLICAKCTGLLGLCPSCVQALEAP